MAESPQSIQLCLDIEAPNNNNNNNNNPYQQYNTKMPQSTTAKKLLLLSISSLAMLGAFIVNTWYNWEMYKYNLNVVPGMQDNVVLGSSGFLVFMNIVSNLFNPIVCAGYIMAFYLLSHRRFQILVFLIWFIFLSVFLTFMKSLIQQARPYWLDIADVKMLQWTCYTEFGCPSGHSMLGLILIQFMIRYFSRSHQLTPRSRILLFMGGAVLQGLVVFSRVILGMHSLNQVLFGIVLGLYSLIPYYTFAQKQILKICLKTCSKSYRAQTLALNTLIMLIMIVLSMLVAFLPKYDNNQDYMKHIHSFEGCTNVEYYQSFQYKCLQDGALVMAVFGIVYGLVFLRNQERLMKVIKYKRNSKKYIIRLILSALMAAIPVAIFMNPFWKKIDLSDQQMAIMLFFLQGTGLLLGNFVLVGLGPVLLQKCKLQHYFSHEQGKQYLFYSSQQLKYMQHQSQISQKQNLQKQHESLMQTYNKNDSINIPYRTQQQ